MLRIITQHDLADQLFGRITGCGNTHGRKYTDAELALFTINTTISQDKGSLARFGEVAASELVYFGIPCVRGFELWDDCVGQFQFVLSWGYVVYLYVL